MGDDISIKITFRESALSIGSFQSTLSPPRRRQRRANLALILATDREDETYHGQFVCYLRRLTPTNLFKPAAQQHKGRGWSIGCSTRAITADTMISRFHRDGGRKKTDPRVRRAPLYLSRYGHPVECVFDVTGAYASSEFWRAVVGNTRNATLLKVNELRAPALTPIETITLTSSLP